MKFDFKWGDIYIVDFDPSVGHEYQKQRPGIVIQSNKKIKKTNLITVVAITSNIRNKQRDDILIKKNNKNNLFCDSIIKVQAIHAFDRSRFIKKIGCASLDLMNAVKAYLKEHFDL